MKQFGKIFRFEIKNYFANKIFVGVTVFLVLLITVVMFFPNIMNMINSSSKNESGVSDTQKPVMLIETDTPYYSDILKEQFETAFSDYEVKITDAELEEIKNIIMSDEAECAFVISGLTSYKYYVNNLSMYDMNVSIADTVLQSIYRINAMETAGLSREEAQSVLAVQIEHEEVSFGKDMMKNYFYTYIMVFALYMVILLYGQMVATNVASEKSSRAMELLITSAKPVSMMFGKVVASCTAGFIQLVLIFGSAFVCYNINESYWSGNEIIQSVFDMPFSLFIYMLIFFILGFFMYAFLYGAISSTVSKLEDINTAVMPVTMLFIIAFLVVMYSMGSSDMDNIIIKVCSYIPFTSPMAMFSRIAMSTVPFYEILISIIILAVSVIGTGVAAARIYRVGVLLYGTRPKPGVIIKAIKSGR